ncbi:probable G-protein coupled receptor Mth-like 6 [Anthonomus grandis grandis]|uniref:probable G-protein coupled receptor Mth-like 6 n=1 Tax=Anthonomus grandis grandis TaxID=2921223 RepID=UPI002166828E|nr:probable G-protein coupled receptor Mth-like 6 [Anthonomus grandis grandis]
MITAFFILVILHFQTGYCQLNLIKCCRDNFITEHHKNGSVGCVRSNQSRFQVWSYRDNFLEENLEGICIDFDGEQFLKYQLTNQSDVVVKSIVSDAVFPKCCPLGHLYNPESHSCLPNSTDSSTYLFSQYIKVGLPHCQIILDKTFENASEARLWSQTLLPGDYCIDKSVGGEFTVRECQEGMEICDQRRCFRKCCPDGQSFVNGATCMDSYVHGLQIGSQSFSPYIEDLDDNYELIYAAKKCPKVGIYRTNPIQYSVKKNGQFKYYSNYTKDFIHEDVADAAYCLEHASRGSFNGFYLFFCIPQGNLEAKFSFTLWSKVVSSVLLFFTIIIYIYVGETKSTFGKILMNYCVTMIGLFLALISALDVTPDAWLNCKFRGYAILFFSISSFAWVNIMSVDIWWTFGQPKRTIGSDQRKKDLKKFLIYICFGWCLPLIYILAIYVLEISEILPESIHPYVGKYKCFLEQRNDNYAILIFLRIPSVIFEIVNIVLFIKTITYCIRVKNEIRRLNDTNRSKEYGRFHADKEKLILIIKLAVTMGLVWIFEVMTQYLDLKSKGTFLKYLEVVLDNLICLQGLFIFIIFICKKKIFQKLSTKLGVSKRRISSSLSSTTQCSLGSTNNVNNVNGHYPMTKRQTTLSMNDSKI